MRLREAFENARTLRIVDGDEVLGDDLWPWCGYISAREAGILRTACEQFPGTWLEIGSYTGWSAAQMASTGCDVVMVDPEYAMEATTGIRVRTQENLKRAGLWCKCQMIGLTSDAFFASMDCQKFAGAFIDGDHDTPCPLNDAVNAAACLADHGAILLHDSRGEPIREAMRWLSANGFTVTEHETANGIAVATR